MSADPLCTYDKTYWICFFTTTPLIFILIYNLHAITNPETFDEVLSNTCGLATSMFVAIASSPVLSCNAWSWACSTTSYFYCCWMICL